MWENPHIILINFISFQQIILIGLNEVRIIEILTNQMVQYFQL